MRGGWCSRWASMRSASMPRRTIPSWVLNFYDQAVFGASNRPLLDGSRRDVFAFGEYYDGNKSLLQSVVRKDITSSGTVGGNRDTLDFPLFLRCATTSPAMAFRTTGTTSSIRAFDTQR